MPAGGIHRGKTSFAARPGERRGPKLTTGPYDYRPRHHPVCAPDVRYYFLKGAGCIRMEDIRSSSYVQFLDNNLLWFFLPSRCLDNLFSTILSS